MAQYTPQEAAVLAGANLRTVQKAITERRIPVRRKSGRRLLDEQAIYTIAVRASVPPSWRIPGHELMSIVGLFIAPHHGKEPSVVPADKKGVWTFNCSKVVPVVRERMALYEKAKDELIERNPDILGGTPVIKGTRLNVYAIAARLDGGETIDDLRADYPYVTREQLEAARLYARANPLRGRPGGRPWLTKKKSRKS